MKFTMLFDLVLSNFLATCLQLGYETQEVDLISNMDEYI